MDLADVMCLTMKNIADVKTLGICAAKWVLLAGAWQLFPMLGFMGRSVLVSVMALSGFFVATIVHNAMHVDVFAHPAVEITWRMFLTSTFGFPVEAYKPTHNANHHVFTNHEKDHLDTAQMKYRWHWLNLVLFFPTVFPNITKLENAYIKKEFQKQSWGFYRFLLQVFCAHGFTLYLIWMDWRRGLLCWFLPNVLGVDGIITMNMLQHDGCKAIVLGEHRGAKMEVDNSRNFTGPVINWLTCNNGYHTIHHMNTNMHWSLYPEMHAKLIEPHIDPSLNERCILRYLWRAYFWPGQLPPHRQTDKCK